MNETEIESSAEHRSIDRPRLLRLIDDLIKELRLGENDGLTDTPRRIADMYLELFSGVDQDPEELLKVQFNEAHDELVILKEILHILLYFGIL